MFKIWFSNIDNLIIKISLLKIYKIKSFIKLINRLIGSEESF